MDQSKIITVLVSSFIIGNAIAWAMGAYPNSFPLQPYSPDEVQAVQELETEIKENPGEADIKTELGEIYFRHNDLDRAEQLLSTAVEESPESGMSLVVLSANKAKQAGAMWDFTWGIRKLSLLGEAVDGLNKAVEIEPEDFAVRLYRMNTLVSLKNRKGSFFRIFEDENWFLEQERNKPEFFPKAVKFEFYTVLAKAYMVRRDLVDQDEQKLEYSGKAEDYSRKAGKPANKRDFR